MTALKRRDWAGFCMWLIQLQMQNAPTDKTHELKTNVISIQLWIFAALPVDAPHLCWKTRVANMYKLVRRRNYSTVLCLSEFMSIDQISAGLPPKPQTKKKKKDRWFRAIRLEWEQAVGDSFHLNRESGVSATALRSGSAGRKLSTQTLFLYVQLWDYTPPTVAPE